MEFSTPMVRGTLKKRYKRFLADVALTDGEIVTAHCPNTGSMVSCGSPGDKVVLSYNPSPKRKLDYSWEYTEYEEGFVGINTQRPNQVVFEALSQGDIPELAGYDLVQKEVKYRESSRIDFLLKDSKENLPQCFVEIKNATLKGAGQTVLFPDAVTLRGQKHIKDLMAMREQGYRAVLFFLVNRPEIESCEIAKDIDPAYYQLIGQALECGVEILAYSVHATLKGMTIQSAVPFNYS